MRETDEQLFRYGVRTDGATREDGPGPGGAGHEMIRWSV